MERKEDERSACPGPVEHGFRLRRLLERGTNSATGARLRGGTGPLRHRLAPVKRVAGNRGLPVASPPLRVSRPGTSGKRAGRRTRGDVERLSFQFFVPAGVVV